MILNSPLFSSRDPDEKSPGVQFGEGFSDAKKAAALRLVIADATDDKGLKDTLLSAPKLTTVLEAYLAAVQSSTREIVASAKFPRFSNYAEILGIGLDSEALALESKPNAATGKGKVLRTPGEVRPATVGINHPIAKNARRIKTGFIVSGGEKVLAGSSLSLARHNQNTPLDNDDLVTAEAGNLVVVPNNEQVAIVCGVTNEEILIKSGLKFVEMDPDQVARRGEVYLCMYTTREAALAELARLEADKKTSQGKAKLFA